MSARVLVLAAAFAALAGWNAQAQILLEAPIGGWRDSAGQRIEYTQTVNYPASSVNVNAQHSKAELIKGRIAGAPKGDNRPIQLVINGLAMPIRLDNGGFERPYAFNPGSNTVEVRMDTGSTTLVKRTQFFESYSQLTSPVIRVLLSWDKDQTDLDLHVVTPDGEHCFYGNRVLRNGGALDVDVTTGYGPEIFSSPAPVPGTYLVYVNYYGSGRQADVITAQVSIVTHAGSPDEKIQVLQVPLRAPGELTLIGSFTYP